MLIPGLGGQNMGNRSGVGVHLHFSQGPFLHLPFLSGCDPVLEMSILVSTIMASALSISRRKTATMVT